MSVFNRNLGFLNPPLLQAAKRYGIVYQKPRREAEKIKYKIFRQFVINYEKNSIFDFVKKLKRDNLVIYYVTKIENNTLMWKTVKYFQSAIVFLQKLKWSSETTKTNEENLKILKSKKLIIKQMTKFKKSLKILAVAFLAVSLTNCKGKENEDNLETVEMETPMTDPTVPETTDAEYETTEIIESDNSGSEDYDKMLDDYDEYVTEYVKFYKKAMKGDNSAMAEYPAMMEKATKLQESMQQAQGNNQLSATQIGRMAKIQTKMLQAMQ